MPLRLSVNHLVVTLGLAFVFGFSFRSGRIRVTVYVPLRGRVGRTLYDLYCPYFSSEVMMKFTRKAMGHFVTLIEPI